MAVRRTSSGAEPISMPVTRTRGTIASRAEVSLNANSSRSIWPASARSWPPSSLSSTMSASSSGE